MTKVSPAPTITAGLVGIAAAAVMESLPIGFAMGAARVWPVVMVVTLGIGLCVGGTAFALIRRTTRRRELLVSICGLIVGGSLPALLLLASFGSSGSASSGGVATMVDGRYTLAGWLQWVMIVGTFALAGLAAAWIAWGIAAWSSAADRYQRRLRQGAVMIGVLLVGGGALALPAATADRSCHNPLRNGASSIGPLAAFDLEVGERNWETVDHELKRFAADAGWSVQVDAQPATDFAWYQQSVCVEPGTQIAVMNFASYTQLSVSVFQPQGGDSWQAPFRTLQHRLETRWPGKVRYRHDQYAAPRPPWASLSPSPAPSSAAR